MVAVGTISPRVKKKFYVLPVQGTYVFSVHLRTNSDYVHTQH